VCLERNLSLFEKIYNMVILKSWSLQREIFFVLFLVSVFFPPPLFDTSNK
jgi:hypothetical protein